MKKKESNNLEEKKPITVKLKENEGNSSKSKNLSQDQEKTQGYKNLDDVLNDPDMIKNPYNTKMIEDAEIEDQKNFSNQMDEIIKNNDKFETIRVLMEILCKELGISSESQFGEIHKALVGVTERYYKSMEDWKNLTKQGIKHDIRQ